LLLRVVLPDLPLADPSGVTAYSVAFSPDGSTIATADDDGSAYLWRPSGSG
jgi:WD40 repeat protein